MGIRLPTLLLNAKQIFRTQAVSTRCHSNIPKGHIAVYVGENRRKRFVVPVSYLNHPSFLSLLNRAEEEFGFNHPSGGLTIPCKEDAFIDLTSRLHTSWKVEQTKAIISYQKSVEQFCQLLFSFLFEENQSRIPLYIDFLYKY